MKIQTEKEKSKKQELKIIGIFAGSLYLIGVYWYLHFASVRKDDPRLDLVSAVNEANANMFAHPFSIHLSGGMITSVLTVTLIGVFAVIIGYAMKMLKKHDNPDTVNGEAHLMTLKELQEYNLKRSDPIGKPENDGPNNMIISKDIRLAIDGNKTRRNCNVLVIGASGAGKSRFFAAPNILQYNSNFVVTDPSGELLNDYGKGLEDNGYAVKVLNLVDMYQGNRYNPFHYIKQEKDVFIVVNTLIKNTTPEGKNSGDPFWENSEKVLISALMLYLCYTAPEEERTFSRLVDLINEAEIDENDANAQSPLDKKFYDLEQKTKEPTGKKKPNGDDEYICNNLAVKQYKTFKLGAGKTLKSILISAATRLEAFKLADVKYLTDADEMHFEEFADTKQALFVIVPTADTTFNFIVSMMYSQLFTSLYTYVETTAQFGQKVALDNLNTIKVFHAKNEKESADAENKAKALVAEIKKGTVVKKSKKRKLYRIYTKSGTLLGWRGTPQQAKEFQNKLAGIKVERCKRRCPHHVRFILDEFANIGQIPQFDQKLATIRKYEISCSIIVQAISQLKEIYEKKWNTIAGNCDTKLLLGCDDSETLKWLLETLGKRTTTVQNVSFSDGGKGSTSYNKSSIDIMTVDQLSMMQEDECLVKIRGERPLYGKKYELTLHPNYKYANSHAGEFMIQTTAKPKDRVNKNVFYSKDDANENLSVFGNVNKSENAVQKNIHVPNANKPAEEKKADNKAKKMASQHAMEVLEEFDKKDPRDKHYQDVAAAGLMKALDMNSPKMPEEKIKETAESVIAIQTYSEEVFDYKLTE